MARSRKPSHASVTLKKNEVLVKKKKKEKKKIMPALEHDKKPADSDERSIWYCGEKEHLFPIYFGL